MAVFSQRGAEPTHPSGASDGVDSQRPNGGAVVAVDGVTHWGIVAGQGEGGEPSEVRQHLIQFVGVDGGVHPAYTIGGDLSELRLQARDQGVV